MVLPLLTFMVDPMINLMSGLHHKCAEGASFSILREHLKITHQCIPLIDCI